jgi:hypothetical protein
MAEPLQDITGGGQSFQHFAEKVPKKSLGRLESVDVRHVWHNEASDFTPWLAKQENIALLGEAIDLDLEVVEMETPVGDFFADILCKEKDTENGVLIENQLELTDHDHLGKLLTYLAGLQTVAIVWVAKKFREEHRAALNWLNDNTADHVNFFGLEIELWKIGDSPLAPKFNVVCKPNDWTKTVQQKVGQLTETQQIYLKYWEAFTERLKAEGSNIRAKPSAQPWLHLDRVGESIWLHASVRRREKWIYAALRCKNGNLWERLRPVRNQINEKVGMTPQDWEEPDKYGEAYVGISKDADPADTSDWPRQHDWLHKNLKQLHEAFAPLIEQLGHGAEQQTIMRVGSTLPTP